MKFNYIFLLVLLSSQACQSTIDNKNKESEPLPKVEEYLVYEGEKDTKIVLVSGDEEYRSEEALPQLAKILNTHHGFDCTVLFAQDPAHKGVVDPNYTNNIVGLEALKEADLVILFTRFRALPDSQMQYFHDYLLEGKPILGIRTATHAFQFQDSTNQWNHWSNFYTSEGDAWDGGFGRLVLGEHWHTHHGHHKHQSTKGIVADKDHPINKGINDGDIWGSTDVYGVRLPLPSDSKAIIMGQVIDREGAYDETDLFYGLRPTDTKIATVNSAAKKAYNPNDPMMPIAWSKSYQIPDGKTGKSFTSTIGSSTDMTNEGVRRLLVNATYHLLEMKVPENTTVEIVGTYEPTTYSFHNDEYWDKKNLKISDLK